MLQHVHGQTRTHFALHFHHQVFAILVQPRALGGHIQRIAQPAHQPPSSATLAISSCLASQVCTLRPRFNTRGWHKSISEQASHRLGW